MVAWVAAPIGAGVALFALLANMKANQANAKARKATFWLELRKMFAEHHKVHHSLDPRGAWADEVGRDSLERYGNRIVVSWAQEKVSMKEADWHKLPGPKTAEQWREVEAYMGLFEHCETMFKDKLIDLDTFNDIYRYRLSNLMANRKIVLEKLGRQRHGYTRFLALLKRVKIKAPPKKNLVIERWL